MARGCLVCGGQQEVCWGVCCKCLGAFGALTLTSLPRSCDLDRNSSVEYEQGKKLPNLIQATWKINGVCYWAAARYEGVWKALILRLKFDRQGWLVADLIAKLCVSVLSCSKYIRVAEKNVVVIPVPMTTSKVYSMGYHPVGLVAYNLAKYCQLPLLLHALKRTRQRHKQQDLDRSGRLVNVRYDFVVSQPLAVLGKVVWLVDDVLTTLATCQTCAGLLRQAGALSVVVLGCARSASSGAILGFD